MESKSFVVDLALIMLAVAVLGNCTAVDRQLRKMNNRINNMQQNVNNMKLNIVDLEFENRELRKELEGEKNRTGELEIKLDSALSSFPAISDYKDSTVQKRFQKIEGVINLLATDVEDLKSKSYKNTNQLDVTVRKAFDKEKALIRKLNETLRSKQEMATMEIHDFISKSNKSLERHIEDIGKFYNAAREHEKTMTTKLDKIITAMNNTDIRINQSETLLTAVSGECSNLKTEDIRSLHNTSNEHEEAILEVTNKLDTIISAMGNMDIRISQNENLLTAVSGECSNLKKEDIGNLHNTTNEHKEAILEMTTKLEKINTAMGNADIRISQNENLLTAVFGECSNLKKEDIGNLHNTTNEHKEAILEMTTKLEKIITAMGNADIRISQNEKLLTAVFDCGTHKDIPNGDVSGDSSVGGTPIISCNSGYSQTGSAQCKIPAAWETDVKCQKDCAILHVANGMVSPITSVSHGSTVTVTCDSGYIVVGNSTAVCNNGEFTAVPWCRRGFYFTDMVVGSSRSFDMYIIDDDFDTPWITGAEFLSDGRLILCDFSRNYRVKLLSSDFTVIDSLKVESRPRDVSAVNSTTVIITIPHRKLLQYVHVLPHFSLSSRIQLDKMCWGVDVVDDEIFTSCSNDWLVYDGEVMVFDLSGSLKRQLGVNQDKSFMFKAPTYLTVSSNTGYIYVSDYKDHKVICLSSAGDVIYEYNDPELDEPAGIYVDDTDNIIVLGEYSHNANVITAGGKKHTILLTSSDGIRYPRSVAYRQSDATLVIGSFNNNNLVVFKLEN